MIRKKLFPLNARADVAEIQQVAHSLQKGKPYATNKVTIVGLKRQDNQASDNTFLVINKFREFVKRRR